MTVSLGRAAAARFTKILVRDRLRELVAAHGEEFAARSFAMNGKTIRWESRSFGDAPFGHRSLWISLHGGGNAPREVNDRQWANQIRLYEPAEGIYLVPRAPTDTWNLWHEAHIDPMLQRLIDDQVALNGVDPNKVYILGYSAGGDGVWQLAPRMADRFAAAATMAGHPGDSSLLPLRDLPFAILVGGADAAYDRNGLARERSAQLDLMQNADPNGYVHMSWIYPDMPHWMERRDAEALPWMAGFSRRTWPDRVVWVQDDVPGQRFYWLEASDPKASKTGDVVVASVSGQDITLSGAASSATTLRLSDALVDLDRPIRVLIDGKPIFSGAVPRTGGAIRRSLMERADGEAAATATLRLDTLATIGN